MPAIVNNSYEITIKVLAYLKAGGTMAALTKALKFKSEDTVQKKIDKQDWSPKQVKNLYASGLLSKQKRRKERHKLRNAEEITKQVKEYVEELADVAKLCRVLGIGTNHTYKRRITLHNWTEQELSILISKRIVDDSLQY